MFPKMKNYQAILAFFGLLALISLAIYLRRTASATTENNPAFPPQIRLVDYNASSGLTKAEPEFQTNQQFDNAFLRKNGSDYIVLPGLYSMTFLCKAKYPVFWTVPIPEQMISLSENSLTTNEFRSSIITNGNPRDQEYYSWLTFINKGEYSISINLTCQSADPETAIKLQSSIYVYKGGKNAFEKQWHHLQLPVCYNDSLKDERFVLPCRPALPTVPVWLEKLSKNMPDWDSSAYVRVAPSPDINYDPKMGYSIRKGLFENDLFGVYRCRINNSDYDIRSAAIIVVLVNVTKCTNNENTEKSKYFKPFTSIRGNASITLSGGNVVCCSGVPGDHPYTNWERCYTAGECKLLQRRFLGMINDNYRYGTTQYWREGEFKGREDCSAVYLRGSSSNVVYYKSEGGSLEAAEFYQPAFSPDIQNIGKRKSGTPLTYCNVYDCFDR